MTWTLRQSSARAAHSKETVLTDPLKAARLVLERFVLGGEELLRLRDRHVRVDPVLALADLSVDAVRREPGLDGIDRVLLRREELCDLLRGPVLAKTATLGVTDGEEFSCRWIERQCRLLPQQTSRTHPQRASSSSARDQSGGESSRTTGEPRGAWSSRRGDDHGSR